MRCPLDGNPLEPLVDDPLAGTSFADRYIIEKCVGAGGMGRVYRARHQRMSRRFAIKVLFGDHAADSKMQQRLAREAEAASRLSHPNVISVLDFGETEEGLLYLVMDYVDGPTLAQVIESAAPLAPDRAIRLVRDCARGLAHAHGRGLIHRDFKADNVLVTLDGGEEVAKIVDFGIAMLNESSSRKLTTEGMVLGTPAVMAPEQAVGEQVDHRTDLFSLGIVLYEMLSGVLPFDGSPLEIARQNLMSQVPPIARRVPGLAVDPRLENLSVALMAKRPDDRPQTAKAVLRTLSEIEGESSREFHRVEAIAEHRGPPSQPGIASVLTPRPEQTPLPFYTSSPDFSPAPAGGTVQVAASGRRRAAVIIGAALVAIGLVALAAFALGPGSSSSEVAAGAPADAGVPEPMVAIDAARAPVAIDAAAVAVTPPDAAPAPAVAPGAEPAEVSRATARRERERERRRRQLERDREERRRQAAARAAADATVTSAAFLARFKSVGRKLNRLSQVDPGKARSLNAPYSQVKSNIPSALRDEAVRSRFYRILGSIDSRATRALGE
jgi:serine/threonine-protein kinase